MFCILPIQNKVVLASNSSIKLQGNMKYIYEELKSQDYNCKVVLLLHNTKNTFNGKLLYLYQMIKGVYHLATSKCFIVDDYYYPIYIITPKEETTIIQVWHACGAFKKFGYSVLDKSFGATESFAKNVKIHSNYDYVLVSTKNVSKIYAEAFNMDIKKIISIGIPRTDIFFNETKKEHITKYLYDKYPILKKKKIILYAPTFRGDSKFLADNKELLDFVSMYKELKDEYVMILKLHPFVQKNDILDDNLKDFIIDLSDYDDINELMLISDVLISDYSSVIFEYALLEKPMYFYAPDLVEYIKERDFYFNYEDFVPGKIIKSTNDLINSIQDEEYDLKVVKDFKDYFFDYKDEKSSQRFIEILLKS